MPSKYEAQRDRRTPPHVSLRTLRNVSGKTLDDICTATGEVLGKPLTRGAMSAIENGHRGVSPAVLHALEVVYGLAPGDLVVDYTPRRRDLEDVPA